MLFLCKSFSIAIALFHLWSVLGIYSYNVCAVGLALSVLMQAMMDRKKKHELPKMQVGFIDFICLPLYEVSGSHTYTCSDQSLCPQPLANLVQGLVPLLEGVKKNRHEWQNLADNPGTYLYTCELYTRLAKAQHASQLYPGQLKGKGKRRASLDKIFRPVFSSHYLPITLSRADCRRFWPKGVWNITCPTCPATADVKHSTANQTEIQDL